MESSTAEPRDLSYYFPIVGSQIMRLGIVRVSIGAIGMYSCIPLLIFLHFTIIVFLYQWVLRPLFKIPRVRWADHVGPIAWWKGVSITLVLVPIMPFQMIGSIIGMRLIYDVMVALPLGMHRVSRSEVAVLLSTKKYASEFNAVGRWFIRDVKNFFVRFSMALEQIESSWCPLRHFETRKGIVYPEHHKKFFGPEQIAEMRRVLLAAGTVSERLPKW